MSESVTIWFIASGLIVAIVVPYAIGFFRRQHVAAERRAEARKLGIDSVTGQYPMINRTLCIGCGGCVDACPEGDVLAVVSGVAEVVNGLRCVGHGFCETACPVGAVKVGLGDVRTRPDIPILSEKNETSIANVFIAGELSGLSLIRHAIAQGRLVAEEIVGRCEVPSKDTSIYDLVIVGAGPAGLSAALVANNNHLSVAVFDQFGLGGTILHYPRRKLVMTQPVEIPSYGPLSAEEYSKEELLEIWRRVCSSNALEIQSGQKVSQLAQVDSHFQLFFESGITANARFVVLALGRRGSPRRLGVPGEDLPKVMYQLVDAQAFDGQRMLVVGGGDSAVEAAIGLARQPGTTVSISYRKDRFFRIKKKNEERITRLIGDGDVRAYFDSRLLRIEEKSVILETNSGEVDLPNDYVIVQAGGVPPYDMLKSWGIAFGGEEHTLVEQDIRLNIKRD
ncbi:MAG: NAD(P)-binding domain-containing protein [Candidatus Zixiibacteriota bacterium]